MRQGPLCGVRIVEFAGIGPAPFCAMLLADLGADIVRIDRASGGRAGQPGEITYRSRRSVLMDLKRPEAVEACLRLVARADALIEGFRPGVMERLGLGPEPTLAHNPRLVYGRMTGWGQTGPLAQTIGHDINYIALTGVLHAIGEAEKPVPPLNLVGDFGGGGAYLAFGLLAGILHARETGRGQVVDCAMTDGSASLMTMLYGWKSAGEWTNTRQANRLDGGAPYYGVYRCADGKWISVGAIEPPFYAALLRTAGVEDPDFLHQEDTARWPALREKLARVFETRTQAQWCEVMDGSDACFAPVLDMDEAPQHPQNAARGTFVEVDGVVQPAPAPRFSQTPGAVQFAQPELGAHNAEALGDWGFSADEVEALVGAGALLD